MNARRDTPTARASLPRPRRIGVAVLLGVATLAATALAMPPREKEGAIGVAPARAGANGGTPAAASTSVPSPTVLYDNLGGGSAAYYAGQGGAEALDDLHMPAGGSLDAVEFEYFDPGVGGTISATVTLHGNPSGLDLAATPPLGSYTVTGLARGRAVVTVPLPDAPAVSANLWVGVRFSSTTAGLIVNESPTIGSSHDLYLEDGNFYDFGGAPKANFAVRLVDHSLFTLTVIASGSGSVTKDPNQTSYLGGTTVQLTPVPAANWNFVGWSGSASGAADPLSLLMDSDKTVTATFAINTYALTYTAGPGGTITGDLSQTVAHGADGAPVTAVPSTGHRFVSWSDGVTTAARTDRNVTASLAVTAGFAIKRYTLSYVAGAGGTILGDALQTVDHGAAGTQVSAVPNPGYTFVGWSDGLTSATRTDLNLTADLSVTASFTIKGYTLAYTAGPGGSILGHALQAVEHGSDGTTVTAVPGTGHHFVSWSDGVTTAARTDRNVTASLAVTAGFAINTYTLTYAAGSGGTLSGNRSQSVTHGGDGTTVTAIPDLGFRFVGWSDGLTSAARTDRNVTAGLAVTAAFAPDNPSCNGDFEVDLSGWARFGSVELSRSAPGRLSSWAMRIKSKSWSDCGIDDAPDCIVGASAGDLYRFTAWVKAGSLSSRGREVQLRIQEYDGSSPAGSQASCEVRLSSAWQKLTLDYVVRRSGASLSRRIVYDPESPGESFFVDDIVVEKLSAPAPPAQNLVVDPSFESGIRNWTRYGEATLSWNTTDARSGARSLRITGKGESFGCDDQPNWVTRVSGVGSRYRFQAWVKGVGATTLGKVKIRVYEHDRGNQVGSTVYSAEVPLGSGWQLLTAEHTVRRANTTLSMRVTDAPKSSRVTETFLVDDVSIELLGGPASATRAGTEPQPEPEPVAALEFARPTVYPNPARGGATLALSLANPGVLRAEIYDVAGRRVRVLANEVRAAAGTHRFALERRGSLEAGIYFYRANVAGVVYRGRFVILD